MNCRDLQIRPAFQVPSSVRIGPARYWINLVKDYEKKERQLGRISFELEEIYLDKDCNQAMTLAHELTHGVWNQVDSRNTWDDQVENMVERISYAAMDFLANNPVLVLRLVLHQVAKFGDREAAEDLAEEMTRWLQAGSAEVQA